MTTAGAVDPSFGTAGLAPVVSVSTLEELPANAFSRVLVQPGGGLIVEYSTSTQTVVARLTAGGQPDRH